MRKVVILILLISVFILQSPCLGQGVEYVNSLLWTGINDIDVQGGYAYCAFQNGLGIIDISTPENPSIISQYYNDGGNSEAIAIEGNHAFLADQRKGLMIFDISDPYDPSLVSQINTGSPHLVEAQGDLVLTVGNHESPDGGEFRLDIVDISEIESPADIGQYTSQHGAEAVKIDGDFLYIAEYYFGVLILDISEPSAPDSVAFIETPGVSANICVNGDYLYIADGSAGLAIYDISNPSSPLLAGSYSGDGYFSYIEVSGNYAYIANMGIAEGMLIINVADPSSPVLAGAYGESYHGFDLVVYADGFCYDITYGHLLDIVDVSEPSNPYSAGSLLTPRIVYDVFIVNNLAYVATEQAGVLILDISDPAVPQQIGNSPEIEAQDIFVLGDYAYVLERFRLYILDISTPENPITLGNYQFPTMTNGLYVSGSYAYVCKDLSGLDIIDISDPENPSLAGNINEPRSSYAVRVINNIAYIAFGTGGFRLYDVSEPSNPQILSSFGYNSQSMEGVEVQDNYAYVAEQYHKLNIFDISDPGNLILVGENTDCDPTGTMLVDHDRAYIAGWYSTLYTLDISDPASPRILGSDQTPGGAHSLVKYQDYIYDADGYSLMILREIPVGIEEVSHIPSGFTLSPNHPNPFNAQTTISYTLPEQSQVTLDIYDVLGRKVESFAKGEQSAGNHSIIFLDKDMPSGIYFYKLTAGEFSQTRKMTLLK